MNRKEEIIQVGKEIENIKNKTNENEDKITVLNNDLGDLNSSVEKIKEDVDGTKLSLDKISKEIEGIEVTAEKTKLNNTNFKSDNVNGALDELFQCGDDVRTKLIKIWSYYGADGINKNSTFEEVLTAMVKQAEKLRTASALETAFAISTTDLLTTSNLLLSGARTLPPLAIKSFVAPMNPYPKEIYNKMSRSVTQFNATFAGENLMPIILSQNYGSDSTFIYNARWDSFIETKLESKDGSSTTLSAYNDYGFITSSGNFILKSSGEIHKITFSDAKMSTTFIEKYMDKIPNISSSSKRSTSYVEDDKLFTVVAESSLNIVKICEYDLSTKETKVYNYDYSGFPNYRNEFLIVPRNSSIYMVGGEYKNKGNDGRMFLMPKPNSNSPLKVELLKHTISNLVDSKTFATIGSNRSSSMKFVDKDVWYIVPQNSISNTVYKFSSYVFPYTTELFGSAQISSLENAKLPRSKTSPCYYAGSAIFLGGCDVDDNICKEGVILNFKTQY